jgi:RNA polymerase sigma factor (sigma-70 family)
LHDLALTRAAAAGDEEAFNEIYDTHADALYMLCLRLVGGDAASARDLTQDVFIQVWKKLHTYRGESALRTWLHRVAINVVRTQQRLKGPTLAEVEAAETGRSAHQPDTATRLDLERALAALPPGARAVIVLHDVEGYKYHEVAEMLDVDIGTVKAQIHRGRKLLREMWSS